RRDNVLELESVQLITYIARLLIELLDGHQDSACSMLPELLAHPAFAIEPTTLWQLGVKSQNERKSWLEVMPDIAELAPIHAWLLEQSQAAAHTPLQRMCDIILGAPNSLPDEAPFISPLYNYYFAPNRLESDPAAYLTLLN